MGRSKLLFGMPPKGIHQRTELAERFRLWHPGAFHEFLIRIEEQARQRGASRIGTRKSPCRGIRARQLVRDGAYKKGVSALTTSVAHLQMQEQHRWAGKLLPCSNCPSDAVAAAVPAAAPESVAESESEEILSAIALLSLRKCTLGGVSFPALSGVGPSGMRWEHLNESLFAKHRSLTSRLLRALANLVPSARAGSLPESGRWILQSCPALMCPARLGSARCGGGLSPSACLPITAASCGRSSYSSGSAVWLCQVAPTPLCTPDGA